MKKNEEAKILEDVVDSAENSGVADEMDQPMTDLEEAQLKAQENLEGWQRERADFANYVKRTEREQNARGETYKVDMLKKFLVVLDDMELAIRNEPQDIAEDKWVKGIELILRKFRSIIENEGIEKIETDAQAFDPKTHQAITFEPHECVESGYVIEAVQNGYKLGDRIIRPALVRVAQ